MLSQLLVAVVAAALPTFNIEKTCLMDTAAAKEERSVYETCLDDEKAAKAKLASEWARYPTNARQECASGQDGDLDGSYVELMVCFQI
jgi:hypothetical protein